METANRLVHRVLDGLDDLVRPGATTQELDEYAESLIREAGGVPADVRRRLDDALNRLVSRTDPNGRTIAYEYDAAGNLARLIYPDGAAVSYQYDAADRLVAIPMRPGVSSLNVATAVAITLYT